MACRIIHFGPDHAHRLMVLRSVGYAIHDCDSLDALEYAFEVESGADAVAITEIGGRRDGEDPEHVISLVRSNSRAPLILFQSRERYYLESEFDLVVPVLTPPSQWLSDIEGLIARCRAVRNQSELLRKRSSILREETLFTQNRFLAERERSRRECARNADLLRGAKPPDSEKNRRD